MTQRKDLLGKSLGKLTVVEWMGYRPGGGSKWKCRCDCGNVVIKNGTQLSPSRAGKYPPSCGCTRADNVRRARWTGHEEISGTYLKNLKSNALQRNIEYNISDEELWEIYLSQEKMCALSGVKIIFGSQTKNSASLDRINSKQGYLKSNVQWIHKTVNSMKWDLDEDTFIDWCRTILNPIRQITENKACVITNHHKNWKGVGNIPLDFFTRYRRMANKRGLSFDITIEYMWDKFVEQNGYCAITNLPICFGNNVTASIDRIDNSLGYSINNIQWVHKDFNSKIRKDLELREVFIWCKRIVEKVDENHRN